MMNAIFPMCIAIESHADTVRIEQLLRDAGFCFISGNIVEHRELEDAEATMILEKLAPRHFKSTLGGRLPRLRK